MAEEKNTDRKSKKPKKKRWYHNLADAYRVAKKTYPRAGWALLGVFFGFFLLGLIAGCITGRFILWPLFGLLLGLTLALGLLTSLVKRASYRQIDGVPGATAAVIGQIKRGWVITEEPVRFNAKTKDLLFRAVGRPGVVLLAEGPATRVQRLINEERAAVRRIAPSAPVHIIKVGNGEGQVKLAKLQRAMMKLPKRITNQEVAALAQRFDAVGTNNLPIPKGIDPTKARAGRRALRG